MPKLVHIPSGTITGIWGVAWRKLPSGKLVPLKLGDQVTTGEQLLTTDQGLVQVSLPQRPTMLGAAGFAEADALLPNLDDLLNREATVAGLTAAGGSGSLTDDSLRVARIAEAVQALDYRFDTAQGPGAVVNGFAADGLDAVRGTSAAGAGNGSDGAGGTGGLPVAQGGALTTPEDTPVQFVLPSQAGSVTAINGQPIAPGQTLPVNNGSVSLQPDGSLVFTPGPNFNGSTDFTYTTPASEAPATVTVGVTPVADAPLARDDALATAEDTPAIGNVLSNDTDPDGDALTVTQYTVGGQTLTAGQTATLPGVGTLLIQSDGAFTFVPAPDYTGPVPVATYTVTDGALTSQAVLRLGDVVPANDAPRALNDAPTATVVEDDAARGALTGNVITGAGGNTADLDVDGDALLITGAGLGATVPAVSAPLGAALVADGLYGQLTLQPNGSFEYVLDNTRPATQTLTAGQQATEVFTYGITDPAGATSTATLTVKVTGSADAVATEPVIEQILTSGLVGEFYGYNDQSAPGNRIHGDDSTAVFGGVNLNTIEDLTLLVDGRAALVGGSADVVGTATSASLQAVDASFVATTLNYGFAPSIDNNLGANPDVAAGIAVTEGALFDFLGADSASLSASAGAPVQTAAGVGSGLGYTTDAAIRLAGKIFLERGNYDFRVTADDGFRLQVGGETLIEFDGNQSPTTRTFSNVEVSDQIDGLQDLELLYWEQGGNARLRVEYRLSSDADWQVLSIDNTALFTPTGGPAVFDNRVQDIVVGEADGSYALRTGVVLDGDAAGNTLEGSRARDVLMGMEGNDTLRGLDGADRLLGGVGDDTLLGGLGADILDGGAGTDQLLGGAGDDLYVLNSSAAADADTLIELVNEGTDSVELGQAYAADINLQTLSGGHLENVTVLGTSDLRVTGNDAANRLVGGSGGNHIDAGLGADLLAGGQGADWLTGGQGADVFQWRLGDAATAGTPTVDHITDFALGDPYFEMGEARAFGASNVEGANATGDRLDLRDLLDGESSTVVDRSGLFTPDIGNLLSFLDVQTENGDTLLRLSSTGGFSAGTVNTTALDQIIVLDDLDLWAATGIAAGNEAQLLQTLLRNGTLVVD